MATKVYVLFKKEIDTDTESELVCVCHSPARVLGLLLERAKEFMDNMDTLEPRSLLAEHDLRVRVDLGKSMYKRCWVFHAEETELVT